MDMKSNFDCKGDDKLFFEHVFLECNNFSELKIAYPKFWVNKHVCTKFQSTSISILAHGTAWWRYACTHTGGLLNLKCIHHAEDSAYACL